LAFLLGQGDGSSVPLFLLFHFVHLFLGILVIP
jgi:hypothetical protein